MILRVIPVVLKRWIKSNERMSKACINSRLRNRGERERRKKIGERIRIRKRTMKESKRTKQRATCCVGQKREGRKDSTHKVRGSRLKAKAEARKRKR